MNNLDWLRCPKDKTELEHLENNDFGCPKCLQIYTITEPSMNQPIGMSNHGLQLQKKAEEKAKE